MVTEQTFTLARATVEERCQRGEHERAQAIEALIDAARAEAVPALDLLTSTQVGDLLGVSGQTIKNGVRQGRLAGYRIGGRIMVPAESVAAYARRARASPELDEISDADAAHLVVEGRTSRRDRALSKQFAESTRASARLGLCATILPTL